MWHKYGFIRVFLIYGRFAGRLLHLIVTVIIRNTNETVKYVSVHIICYHKMKNNGGRRWSYAERHITGPCGPCGAFKFSQTHDTFWNVQSFCCLVNVMRFFPPAKTYLFLTYGNTLRYDFKQNFSVAVCKFSFSVITFV